MEQLKCEICGNEARWRWTDTHGVAQHVPCGAPYRLYHYQGVDGDKRDYTKGPQLLIREDWVERCKRFWEKEQRPMPGGFSFSQDYEMSDVSDRDAFKAFCEEEEKEKDR